MHYDWISMNVSFVRHLDKQDSGRELGFVSSHLVLFTNL